MFYLSTHAGLHAGPHAWVAHVLHLHAHALPRLVHELMMRRNSKREDEGEDISLFEDKLHLYMNAKDAVLTAAARFYAQFQR